MKKNENKTKVVFGILIILITLILFIIALVYGNDIR